MIWSDDPVRDAAAYDAECERRLKIRPICCKCEEHIQGEYAYEIDGELYCESCAEDWLNDQRVAMEDY